MTDEPKAIVKAEIKGKIVTIDLASENRNAYQDMKDRIEYLGSGLYYSYNDTKASDKKATHFWKWRA